MLKVSSHRLRAGYLNLEETGAVLCGTVPPYIDSLSLLLRGTPTPQHVWFGVWVHPEGIHPEGHPEPTLCLLLGQGFNPCPNFLSTRLNLIYFLIKSRCCCGVPLPRNMSGSGCGFILKGFTLKGTPNQRYAPFWGKD